MSSGRLDEEMSRMNDIAEAVTPRCVVLFNESFASTNEREGSEIARQIIRGLLEADVTVFYVTHLYDLAESFFLEHSGSTLFLRAERQVDGQRSFKLVEAEPLPTSFGEDLYHRLGGFMTLAMASHADLGGET
jgi:DNA mismatch repair ATPase MutS